MALAPDALKRWMTPDSRVRRLVIGFAIYAVCVGVFAGVAAGPRLTQHTPFNHYALLADAWLHGRLDLAGGYPGYTGGNDFAQVEERPGVVKTYVSFPPFPAVLMIPFVKMAGTPEEFRDGQFVIWLAGLGPAFLFLVLEKLRRTARSPRTETQNAALSLLFAFGTVYFFTAVEGTVWFAAHVVAVALAGLYILLAIDGERPLLCGLLLAFAWLTRPPMLLMAPLFALEVIRTSTQGGLPTEGPWRERLRVLWQRLDKKAVLKKYALFAVPILGAFALMAWMNDVRYHEPSPFAFGHEHLTVAWRARMERWGLFGYHYLAKNLGVSLTVLPWTPPKGTLCFEYAQPSFWKLLFDAAPMANGQPIHCTPFKINEHGLALWFTTPIYFWLVRPKTKGWLYAVVALAAILPAAMDLFYQNSGWRQFGYRFSNDYALLLFVLLAIGARPMRWLFGVVAAWGVAWSIFGAVTFDHPEHGRFYFGEGTQQVLYQPDT